MRITFIENRIKRPKNLGAKPNENNSSSTNPPTPTNNDFSQTSRNSKSFSTYIIKFCSFFRNSNRISPQIISTLGTHDEKTNISQIQKSIASLDQLTAITYDKPELRYNLEKTIIMLEKQMDFIDKLITTNRYKFSNWDENFELTINEVINDSLNNDISLEEFTLAIKKLDLKKGMTRPEIENRTKQQISKRIAELKMDLNGCPLSELERKNRDIITKIMEPISGIIIDLKKELINIKSNTENTTTPQYINELVLKISTLEEQMKNFTVNYEKCRDIKEKKKLVMEILKIAQK